MSENIKSKDPHTLPCAMVEYNEVKRKDEIRKPSVYCSYACGLCGWNPEEAKRRMETGEYITRANGVKTLIFKRRVIDVAST